MAVLAVSAPKRFDKTIGIAFLGFIVLGMPSGLLGIAWPSIRELHNLPQTAIGIFLAADTIGYMVSSFSSGPIINRFGIGKSLLLAYVIRGTGLSLIFVAPSWNSMILLILFAGIGGGIIDAGLNTYVAGYTSTRLMNWLHAFFGVGATIGPLVMTLLIKIGAAWHWGYVFAGSTQLLVAGLFLLTLSQWQPAFSQTDDGPARDGGQEDQPKTASPLQTLYMPLIWVSVLIFGMYAGLEAAAGQWTYSLFTEARGISMTQAGLWVSIYWGSFTIGRFFFGFIGDTVDALLQVRTCLLGLLVGAALIWMKGNPLLSGIGLVIFGFSLAPIFAILITETPGRVGAKHAANAIGFQVGGASIGVTLVPWIIGLFAEHNETRYILSEKLPILDMTSLTYNLSLEVVAPCLFITSIALFVIHEILVFISTTTST